MGNVAIFENRTFCIAKKNKSSQWACVISSSRYRSHIRDACCSCCRLLLSAVLCRVLVSQSPVIRLALAHHLSTSYIQSLIDIMAEQESDAGVAAAAGILPYGIGFLLKFFTLTSIRWTAFRKFGR